jgi:hypothetical protein
MPCCCAVSSVPEIHRRIYWASLLQVHSPGGTRKPTVCSARAISKADRTDATAANRKLSTDTIQREFQPHHAWRDVQPDGTRGLHGHEKQTIIWLATRYPVSVYSPLRRRVFIIAHSDTYPISNTASPSINTSSILITRPAPVRTCLRSDQGRYFLLSTARANGLAPHPTHHTQKSRTPATNAINNM